MAIDPISFVRRHGVVLESAKGQVPNLADAVAGVAVRGSWWKHPEAKNIFRATRLLRDKVGGKFSAWGGHITSFNLALKPARKIVQAWRANGWWPEHYSIAIFEIERTKRGSKLKFTQIGVPPHRYSDHYRGWIETYWTPMKEMIANGKISDKSRARVKASRENRIKRGHFRRRISAEA